MKSWKLRAAAMAVMAFVAVSCFMSGCITAVRAEEAVLNGPEMMFSPGANETVSGRTIKGLVTVGEGACVVFEDCTFIGGNNDGTGELGVRIDKDGSGSIVILKDAKFMIVKYNSDETVPVTVSNVFGGGTVGIDSVMTSSYYLDADGVRILKVNAISDVEESERLIDAWFRIQWYKEFLMYKVSFVPGDSGLIATHNARIEYTKNILYFPNVLEISAQKKTVTVDFLEGHEELAAQYASESGASADGTKVSVQIEQGNVLDADNELHVLFNSFFGSVNYMDKGERLFTKYFLLKPLKDFSDWDEVDLEAADTTPVDEDTVFYLTWMKSVGSVNVTVDPLVCGQTVTAEYANDGPVGESVRSYPAPSFSADGDVILYDHPLHNTDCAFWADNKKGDFELGRSCSGFYKASPAHGGDEVYATVFLQPKMGFYFPDDYDDVLINGKAPTNIYLYDKRFTGLVPVVHVDEDGDGWCDVCSDVVHPVTVKTQGHGSASASCSSAASGECVMLSAVPEPGYRFREWQVVTGGVSISDNSFMMPANAVELIAVFEPDPDQEFAVTVTDDGNGKAFATPASGPVETQVTLKAEPDEGHVFKEWQVVTGDLQITGDTFKLTAEDVVIKAVFDPVPCTLTVTLDPPEGGSADGGGVYSSGTYATLSAQPSIGYEFTGWVLDGEVVSTYLDYTFKVTEDGDYTATFAKVVYMVTKGAGGTWVKGSGDGFTVAIKRSLNDDKCIDHFTGVALDGKNLAVSAYKAEKGSTVVTLGTDTLEALSEGDHTVTVQFDDGKADAVFKIAVQASERENPSTGVNGHFGMLAVMSALSIGAVLHPRKRES